MIFSNENKVIIRKNVKMKVYFKDQTETFETYSDYNGKQNFLDAQLKMSYGESMTKFVYNNLDPVYEFLDETESCFESINKHDRNYKQDWNYILGSCIEAIGFHPYFLFLKQEAFNLYQKEEERIQKKELIAVTFLSKLIPIYQAIKEDLLKFISVSLKPKTEPDYSNIYNFISLNKENKLLLGGELAYGNIVSELLILNDNYTIEYNKVIFPERKLIKGKRPMGVVEVLYPNTLVDLHKFIMAKYLQEGIKFKSCKNCNSYFAVMGNSKAEYCNRLMEGSEKTCRQAGSMRIYQSKKLEDPINQVYTRAYKTRNARIRYGSMTREEFDKWSAEAREHRDKCLAGLLEFSEFEEWLSK